MALAKSAQLLPAVVMVPLADGLALAARHGLTLIAQTDSAFFSHALAAYAEHGAVYQPLIDDLKRRAGVKGKNLFMPLRAALTGELHGPELARILALTPVDLAKQRLAAAIRPG